MAVAGQECESKKCVVIFNKRNYTCLFVSVHFLEQNRKLEMQKRQQTFDETISMWNGGRDAKVGFTQQYGWSVTSNRKKV